MGADSASADRSAEVRAEGPRTEAAAGTVELVALLREREAKIDDLSTQLLARTEAAAMWQARARVLDERVRMLEAPKPEPAPAPEPFPAPIPPTPNAAPWWRRWWPALVGAGVTAAVAVSSCGASGTVRHAALCGQAREVMDAGGRDGVPFAAWNQVHAVVGVAARVC